MAAAGGSLRQTNTSLLSARTEQRFVCDTEPMPEMQSPRRLLSGMGWFFATHFLPASCGLNGGSAMRKTKRNGRENESSREDGVLSLPIDKRRHARLLGRVGRAHFKYFLLNQNPKTGLVLDRSTATSPASIAAVGFALTAYGCACRRGWVSRQEAASYALKTLKTLWSAPQGIASEGTSGYRGFFYHFLDPETGVRAQPPRYWKSELSTIDTALLMAGVLFARNFFRGKNARERKIRELADALYRRVEWDWMVREDKLIRHGWTPENGVIPYVYKGYNEALLLYVLALGSPTHPAPSEAWDAYLESAPISERYGIKYVSMPGEPLFPYQYPHVWIDFRGIRDRFCTARGWDWFENSRRMSLVQYLYAQENPLKLIGYGGWNWSQTACDGPGDFQKEVNGRTVQFRA